VNYIKSLLYDTNIDFAGKRHIAAAISIITVLAAWVAFAVVGPNWGIDFTGGTEIHLQFEDSVEISEMRGTLRELGLSDDAVQKVGGELANEFAIRIQDASFGAEEMRTNVETQLRNAFGAEWINGEPDFDAEVGARMVVNYNGDELAPQVVAQVLQDISGVAVQSGKEERQVVIKLPGLAQQVQKQIGEALTGHTFEVLSIDAVGPKVGGELRRQGFISVVATLGLVLLYVAFRFDIAFAPGAIVALIHDVSIVVGIFIAMQLEFNLPMIGALLTIVGYSLNDTIVIYDRIRENRDRYRRKDLIELVNVSINETLARTVATSVTTMLAVSMFLIIGGPVIRNFMLAMFLGIIFGTYSTIYVASPMILVMEDVKPHLSKLMVAPAVKDMDEDEQAEVDAALSATERRRRERAASEADSP
jgi:preprotein translocase subunit SecF